MTMVVPSVDVDHITGNGLKKAGSTSNLSEKNLPPGPSTTQTWPFVEVYCNKRYFYLEAQSYIIDGHPELFLWLWFLGEQILKNQAPSDKSFDLRIGPRGDALQVPPDRHPWQVRVLLQGACDQPDEVFQ